MFVIVYGTLKRGYGNNRLLQTSTFVSEVTVPGYKLYNCGFPVAKPSENDIIRGELWDIKDSEEVLASLDRLESEGSMYDRVNVAALDPEGNEVAANMYVGCQPAWSRTNLPECPKNERNEYVWSR